MHILGILIIIFTAFLAWIHVQTTCGQVVSVYAVKRPNLNDKVVLNNRLLWTRYVQAMYLCLGECSFDESCVSVFYNNVSTKCQGHSVTFGVPDVAEEEIHSKYYLKPIGQNFIGDACATSGDCITINAECRNGACWCAPGYSFSPRTQECRSDCVKEGSDFMEVRDHFISMNNMETFEPVSLHECFSLCVNRTEYDCVSLEYGRTSEKCFLQNVTQQDVPHRWYLDDTQSFNISYYQRDCA